MDGVFMKKIIRFSICILLAIMTIYLADVLQDKQVLQENIIRLHVVANSDIPADQTVKLQVKDAIVNYLQSELLGYTEKEQVTTYIGQNLSDLENLANYTLSALGVDKQAVVTFEKEIFDTRVYDTFSLPAGIYDSLRIIIGDGQGKNWWCVVFPSLCLPATGTDFQEAATSAGFSENLGNSLRGGCNIRFFLLDCFGKIEKLFN